MAGLAAEVLDVAVVSLVACAPLAVGAPLDLETE
jgi:hypothetical protein